MKHFLSRRPFLAMPVFAAAAASLTPPGLRETPGLNTRSLKLFLERTGLGRKEMRA